VGRLARFLALSPTDRRLLLRAFAALAAVDITLRVNGFQHAAETASRSRHAAREVTSDDYPLIATYARWLSVAARHHIIPFQCLHRSLALQRWLVTQGLPGVLRLGVRKENGELKAHAWVELAGQVVGDEPSTISTFVPLIRRTGELPNWTRSASNVGSPNVGSAISGRHPWR
jgi:hypothetical protein